MKLKIITGFSDDEKFIIDAEELHKAYFLFNNPDKRGVFNNGIAIIGKNIQAIKPDYHATMGWNVSHKLDGDDWNEIKSKGIDLKFQKIMSKASAVGRLAEKNLDLLQTPLSKVLVNISDNSTKSLVEKLGEKLST